MSNRGSRARLQGRNDGPSWPSLGGDHDHRGGSYFPSSHPAPRPDSRRWGGPRRLSRERDAKPRRRGAPPISSPAGFPESWPPQAALTAKGDGNQAPSPAAGRHHRYTTSELSRKQAACEALVASNRCPLVGHHGACHLDPRRAAARQAENRHDDKQHVKISGNHFKHHSGSQGNQLRNMSVFSPVT